MAAAPPCSFCPGAAVRQGRPLGSGGQFVPMCGSDRCAAELSNRSSLALVGAPLTSAEAFETLATGIHNMQIEPDQVAAVEAAFRNAPATGKIDFSDPNQTFLYQIRRERGKITARFPGYGEASRGIENKAVFPYRMDSIDSFVTYLQQSWRHVISMTWQKNVRIIVVADSKDNAHVLQMLHTNPRLPCVCLWYTYPAFDRSLWTPNHD